MRRRIGVVGVVLAVVVAASGCSVNDVQFWFKFMVHRDINATQARTLADALNAKRRPGGCDPNYTGGCIPDNIPFAHCAGTSGPGIALKGPYRRVGRDSLQLDHDNDMRACADPVGHLERFGQVMGDIRLSGWAFDPHTTAPIDLEIEINGHYQRVSANEPRPDVAAAFPGVGGNHGFDLFTEGGPAGTSVKICVRSPIPEKPGLPAVFGCRIIVMHDPSAFTAEAGSPTQRPALALLEGADAVNGGIHVRGWAADAAGGSALAGTQLLLVRDDQWQARVDLGSHAIADPWLNDATGAPPGTAASFDFVVPRADFDHIDSVCILPAYSCRGVNT